MRRPDLDWEWIGRLRHVVRPERPSVHPHRGLQPDSAGFFLPSGDYRRNFLPVYVASAVRRRQAYTFPMASPPLPAAALFL